MATTLNMTLLLRRANFADNCVLQAGEPGYHTTNKEFKIGDGTTPWKDLPIANKTQIEAIVSTAITAHAAGYYTKAEIDSIKTALQEATSKVASDLTAEVTAREQADTGLQNQIDTKLATETFNNWKNTHENDHAKTTTEITAEITTAVAGEKTLREAADKDITDTLGTGFDKGDNTVAKKIAAAEAAAKAHAEEKATKAYTDAVAEAENKDAARATTTATNLANAVSALETKITNGDSATLQSAKDYTDAQVAAEAKLRSDADAALDERIDKLEAFFEGADHDGETGGLKDALDTLVEIQTYIETDGAAADKMVKDIAQNASDIDALESRMGTAEGTITSLGTNKLDKSVYETYINGKAMSDEELKGYTDSQASAAITKAGELDSTLESKLNTKISTDIAAAISAEVTRSNAYADKAETDAITTAASQADIKDAALKTAIEGTSADASDKATIAGAKKYAAEKAATAEQNAKDYADSLAGNYDQDGAAAQALKDAKAYTDEREIEIKKYADQAKADAISTVVGTANDGSDADTINGVRAAFAAADTAVLTAAQNYTDKAVKENIIAGNTDIVVTVPTEGNNKDKTVISHKVYGTGTYTKPDSVNDANFVTSVQIENGHVTGATVKSLAEALSEMTFIFDGGTSAN